MIRFLRLVITSFTRKSGVAFLLFLSALGVCASSTLAETFFSLSAPTPSDISEQEAVSTAKQVWIGFDQSAEDIIHEVQLGTNIIILDKQERIWVVTFFLEGTPLYYVLIRADDGNILESDVFGEGQIPYFERVKGRYYFWSLKDKALFEKLFLRTPGETTLCGIPTAVDLSQENAAALAKEVVKSTYPITSEELSNLLCAFYFYIYPVSLSPFGDDDNRVWGVTFHAPIDTSSTYEKRFTVILSARDGSLLHVTSISEELQ